MHGLGERPRCRARCVSAMSLFGSAFHILLPVLALLLAAATVRVHAEPEDYFDFRGELPGKAWHNDLDPARHVVEYCLTASFE